ncbi:MAG TPA: hypothetical protein ENK59_05595 [Thioploca sp.]|nr:hypothetical protein [Thioploca sp.]
MFFLRKVLFFLVLLILLNGCIGGGSEENNSSNPNPIDIPVDIPVSENIIVINVSSLHDSLPLNSKDISINATVNDIQGNIIEDGTVVNFTTNLGIITESVPTYNGIAEAMFTPDMQSGIATITANVGSFTDTLSIIIRPGKVGTIEISKVEPRVIGVVGSGLVQNSKIEFLVKDKLGNMVADNTIVKFTLGTTTLGGKETITADGITSGKEAEGTTNNGLVSVTLNSGAVAGNIDVIATVDNEISTIARVTIVSSFPDADHLSLAAEFLNIAGGVTFGLQDNITAYVGDRFGNIVPDGTTVSFITEGGTIGKSIGGGAFTTTTEFGQATAILQSAGPSTPSLGGEMTLRYAGFNCADDFDDKMNYLYVNDTEPQNLCGNPGLVTIVAYTTGTESFIDVNGNGIFDVTGEKFTDSNNNNRFDVGESFIDDNGNNQFDGADRHTDLGFVDSNNNNKWDMGEIITNKGDMSEPYIDANDNKIFDLGELYVDVNDDGNFNGPDGIFQANITIWQDMRILFSAHPASVNTTPVAIKITPTEFSISKRGKQTFLIENIGDIYGNALVKDTVLEIKTNNGLLVNNRYLLEDSQNNTSFNFTLSNNPCEISIDKKTQEKITICSTRVEPESVTITISINSTNNDKQGNNGKAEFSVSGIIN